MLTNIRLFSFFSEQPPNPKIKELVQCGATSYFILEFSQACFGEHVFSFNITRCAAECNSVVSNSTTVALLNLNPNVTYQIFIAATSISDPAIQSDEFRTNISELGTYLCTHDIFPLDNQTYTVYIIDCHSYYINLILSMHIYFTYTGQSYSGPIISSISNRSHSVPLSWDTNPLCKNNEHAILAYHLTAVAALPECNKVILTNKSEVTIDGLCPGTEYEISLLGIAEDTLWRSDVVKITVETLSRLILR